MSVENSWISGLGGIVGEANLVKDPDRLKEYAVDGVTPGAAVSPGSAEEISKLLALANREKLAIVPRGNGTKMSMGGIPAKVDIVLLTKRLNRIVEHDVPNLSLTVESGMTLAEIQKTLAEKKPGSFLPLDPSFTEKATIGGIIATNSSGPRRYIYGTARDLLLGLKAVAPNGDIVAFGGKTVKNVSGYDMTKLMSGSFGSLGIITEITTKLLPVPEASATFLASFSDLSRAGELARKVLHSVLLPSAMELLEGKAADRLNCKGKYVVAFSIEGVAEAVERQAKDLGELAKNEGGSDVIVLRSTDDRDFWIKVRDFALNAAAPVTFKANVLLSKLTESLGNFEKSAKEANVEAAFIGHAGNGIINGYCTGKKGDIVGLIGKCTDEAVKAEGNLILASAPTDLKKKTSVWGRARGDEAVMRSLKESLDPNRVLNPGRFVGGI